VTLPDAYFDVAVAAHDAGYRVLYLRPERTTRMAIFACAADVASAAYLCVVPILTRDPDIRDAAQKRGVRVISTEERL
jgi:predicted regulator of amino acid metabolism with ACT domain